MKPDERTDEAAAIGSSFPGLLRRRREESGLSQNGLAERAGRDPGTINRLESGKRAPVNRELVEDLSRALGLSDGEHDELLAAAGHFPEVFRRIGLGDSDLRLVADLLGDERLSASDRRDFRLAIRVAARRWRDVRLDDLLGDGGSLASGLAVNSSSSSPPSPVEEIEPDDEVAF